MSPQCWETQTSSPALVIQTILHFIDLTVLLERKGMKSTLAYEDKWMIMMSACHYTINLILDSCMANVDSLIAFVARFTFSEDSDDKSPPPPKAETWPSRIILFYINQSNDMEVWKEVSVLPIQGRSIGSPV